MEVERKVITFWCSYDRFDYKLLAERRYQNARVGEVWKAQCPNCHRMLIRLINNASQDPYFRLSRIRQRERKLYADDLLQPGDPRFDLLYPHHKRQIEAHYEKQEREAWEKKEHQK